MVTSLPSASSSAISDAGGLAATIPLADLILGIRTVSTPS